MACTTLKIICLTYRFIWSTHWYSIQFLRILLKIEWSFSITSDILSTIKIRCDLVVIRLRNKHWRRWEKNKITTTRDVMFSNWNKNNTVSFHSMYIQTDVLMHIFYCQNKYEFHLCRLNGIDLCFRMRW